MYNPTYISLKCGEH